MTAQPKKFNNLENEGLKAVKLLQQNGFKAFWVGGTVRDRILHRQITNLDIATSALPDQVLRIFSKSGYETKDIGKSYGTILVITKYGPLEITTFRKEGRYLDRRHPSKVEFIDDYKEDAKRRDFTVNALYIDPVTQKILDPENGLKDLKAKLLRFVGNPKQRIEEDALRMLRAARLSSTLEMKIEKNSFAAIKTRAKYIQSIAVERVRDELEKILISDSKHEGVTLLDQLGLLKFIMPEVDALKKVSHKSKVRHLEGNMYVHSLLVLKNCPSGNLPVAYAALYHDTGTSTTMKTKIKSDGKSYYFPNHENVSAELFQSFARRLKISSEIKKIALWITKMHMLRIDFVKRMNLTEQTSIITHKYFPYLAELWRADAVSNLKIIDDKKTFAKPAAYELSQHLLNIMTKKKKLIDKSTDGEFIMSHARTSPGKHILQIKNQIISEIISGKIKNISDAEKYLKTLQKMS